MLQFGRPDPDLTYRLRPTAFGLVLREGLLACVRVERGAQSYFDLNLTAKVGRNFSWQLGVNNIFDREPPLAHSGSGAFGASACGALCNGNTYPGTYDSLGRYIYTGVTLDF